MRVLLELMKRRRFLHDLDKTLQKRLYLNKSGNTESRPGRVLSGVQDSHAFFRMFVTSGTEAYSHTTHSTSLSIRHAVYEILFLVKFNATL
jgi:hypothetical protein